MSPAGRRGTPPSRGRPSSGRSSSGGRPTPGGRSAPGGRPAAGRRRSEAGRRAQEGFEDAAPGGGGRRPPARAHGLGGEQVEGRQAVLELLRVGARPVRELWVAEGQEPSPQLDEIERLATRRKVRTLLVPRRRFDSAARTESPQGVLARAKALEETALDDLCTTRRGKAPFLLVLDGVTDPHNVGSLLRTADCAGVRGVVLARHRAAHVTPTVAKVAAGAVEHVPIAVVPGIPAALTRLADLGVTAVGLDAGARTSLYELGSEVEGPVALVLGAEGRGLARLTRERCAVLASIPRHGALASLNVATAGAVACFELARRRG